MNEPQPMTPSTSQSASRWLTLAACFLVVAITNGSGFSFGVFLNPCKESFGATTASISAAYSITLWMFAVSGVLTGWAVDRFGPSRTIMAGAFILGSGCLSSSFVQSLWQLYLTSALIGIGLSSGYIPTMTTVSQTFTKWRGLALGINSAGVGFGPLIMAPLQTQMILLGGWRFAYLVTACIVGVTIPIALLVKRFPKKENEWARRRTNPPPSLLRREKITDAFRTRALWLICFVFLTIGVAVQTVVAHVIAYSQYLGISPMVSAGVLSSITGVSMVGRIFVGTASDWIGRRNALVACTFFEGVMLLWLLTTSSTWSLFVFGIIFGFFYGGHAPQLPALVAETIGFENMGAILGIANLFWGIGAAIGPLTTGYLFDVTGSYTAGFTLATVSMFLASGIGFLLPSQRSPSRPRWK